MYQLASKEQVLAFPLFYVTTLCFGAMVWGWLVDGHAPDRWDWIGGGICVLGAIVIVVMPRS